MFMVRQQKEETKKMQKQITVFGRGTTLNQAVDEMKENGLVEITKVIPNQRYFEYNIKD